MATLIHVFLGIVSILWLWRSRTHIAGTKCKMGSDLITFTSQPPNIQVTPTNSDQGGHRTTLNCSYSGSDSLMLMQIQKSLNGTMRAIVTVDTSHERRPYTTDQHLPPSAETECHGRFEDRYVGLTLVKTRCEDEALYRCLALFTDSVTSNLGKDCSQLYLPPSGPVTLAVSPEGRSWKEGDEVTLTCTGPAPMNSTHTKVALAWQFRQTGSDSWRSFNSSTANLVDNETTPVFADIPDTYCGRVVREVVKVGLRKEDLGMEVVCGILLDDVEYNPEHRASVTLTTEGGDDEGDDDEGDEDKEGGRWSPALLGGLGAGAGGVLLLGLGAWVRCLTRRPPQPDDTARQGPGMGEASGLDPEGTTDSQGSVSISQVTSERLDN